MDYVIERHFQVQPTELYKWITEPELRRLWMTTGKRTVSSVLPGMQTVDQEVKEQVKKLFDGAMILVERPGEKYATRIVNNMYLVEDGYIFENKDSGTFLRYSAHVEPKVWWARFVFNKRVMKRGMEIQMDRLHVEIEKHLRANK